MTVLVSTAVAYQVDSGPAPVPDTDLRWQAFRRFTSHDGLPQNTVYALAQDDAGFIYAGTEEGVARYDGQHWQRVAFPDAVAASRPFANLLEPSPDGAIWIGTDNAGLLRYADGTMRAIALDGQSAATDIEALLADGAQTWAGTSRGLFLCDASACREIEAARGLQVAALLLAQTVSGAVLYVGTNLDGLYRIDDPHGKPVRAAWHLTREDGLPNSAIRSLAQWGGPDGSDLWIGTGRGIARLRGEHMTVYGQEQGVPQGGVLRLLPSRARDAAPVLLAAFGYGGIGEFHDDGSWQHTARANGLPDDAVLSLLQTDTDRQPPVLWMGTTHGGVVRREMDAWAAFDEREGLPHRVVMSIGETRFPDGVEAVWLGSIGGAVRWHGAYWESWLPPAYMTRIVYAVASDGGTLWVGTERGLLRMDRDGAREYTLDNSILPGASVIELLLEPGDPAHTLWIGTHHGLARMRAGRLEIENLSDPPQESFVRVLRATALADGTHRLWVGTDSGLLYKSTNGWVRLPRGCLAQASVMDAQERGTPGQQHVLWVASRDGVSLVDLDDDMHCRTLDALPRSIVYQLQFDGAGRIYAFGVEGVTRLRADAAAPGGYVAEHFGLADGLPGLEFNRASLVDHAGRIWGGSTEGVVMYDPAFESAPAPPRPLRLLAAREEAGARLTDGIMLDAAQNNVAFDFSLLSYQRDHMTRYRAELSGLNAPAEDWNDSGHRSYSRLPPGDYRFEVRARDGHDVESGPLSLRFHIGTPLWRRPEMIALYALTLLAIGLGVGRLRARALQRRADRLEGEVAQRTSDLAEANRQLERASLTDPLTGMWNRRYFALEMQPESDRTMRRAGAGDPHADVVLLLVDIDHFKRINDALGHAGGDAVLVEFARRVADLVRSSDIALRWGGEEFLLVLRDSERKSAAAFAERVRHAIDAQPFAVGTQRIAVTCSIGWAAFPFRREEPRACSLEQVIAFADQALYCAKERGRNQVCGAFAASAARVGYSGEGAAADVRS
jgi:diguanylate cyclase (GGDEF)-like protein